MQTGSVRHRVEQTLGQSGLQGWLGLGRLGCVTGRVPGRDNCMGTSLNIEQTQLILYSSQHWRCLRLQEATTLVQCHPQAVHSWLYTEVGTSLWVAFAQFNVGILPGRHANEVQT